ncbi:MAG TPA: hypothetical protein VGL56_11460 [Fimbriimonadaceae bacterium]|jgi:hypothetical protein
MDPEPDILKARQALDQGLISSAKQHLTAAKMEGADPQALRELEWKVQYAEQHKHSHSHKFTVIALAVAAVGYFVLSFQSPGQWTQIGWGIIAFLIIPAIQGVILALGAHPEYDRTQRFKNGLGLGAAMMAAYTLFNLLIVSSKIGTHKTEPDVPTVVLLVTAVYSLAAGLVCGLVSAMFPKKEAA